MVLSEFVRTRRVVSGQILEASRLPQVKHCGSYKIVLDSDVT